MGLIINHQPFSVIHDGTNARRYADVCADFDKFDNLFRPHEREIACLFVPAKNDIASIQLIYYLMHRNINFLLSHEVNTPPAFCDYITHWTKPAAGIDTGIHLSLKKSPNKSSALEIPTKKGAVIFLSSGTTGSAKYVYHTTAKLLRNAQNIVNRFSIMSTTKILIPLPINHMFGFGVGLLPALLTGANISLVDGNNIVKFTGALKTFSPHFALVTPSFCKMLVSLNRKVSNDCCFITAGDVLSSELMSTFESLIGKVLNLYGCTELGAIATTSINSTDHERTEGRLTCLPGVRIKVDRSGIGRIYCHHQAGFESYIDANGRKVGKLDHYWFDTNDFGVLVNGQFVVMGRADHTVKRFGFLVPLHQIENALLKIFTCCSEVAVVTDDKESIAGFRVIAFLESRDDAICVSQIGHISSIGLPRHLRPDVIIPVPEIPRLRTGKVDREKLKREYLLTETKIRKYETR